MTDQDYSFNGSAAYQVHATAVPQPRPARLPEDKPLPRARQGTRPRLVIAPLAAFGMLLAAFLLLMVIYSYVQLYEATNRANSLKTDISKTTASTEKLHSTYESRIDLAQIERRAKELGMTQPSTRQIVYLTIPGADHGDVLQVDRRSFFQKAWDALCGSFNGVLEYLH